MKSKIKKSVSALLAILMIMTVSVTAFAANISSSEAQEIALTDANVSKSEAVFTKTELDTENGKKVYEIDFYVKTDSSITEYEYEILASNGKIIDKEKETKSITVPSPKKKITKSKAISIALKNAGVDKSKALKLKAKKDTENGKSVYDVDFYVKKSGKLIEYDYTILVSNGKILEKSVETEAVAPEKVTGLKVKAKTSTSVTLKWNQSKGADGYIVYKYDKSEKKYVKVAATKSLSYKITDLSKSVSYKFAVKSYVREEGITLPCVSYTKISVKTSKR